MKRKPLWASIGSVASVRDDAPGETIEDLAYALAQNLRRCRVERELRKEMMDLLVLCEEFPPDGAGSNIVIRRLVQALEHFAPPHSWFGRRSINSGSNESEWGYWPITENDELPRLLLCAGSDMRYAGSDAYLVNDHGNVSCGRFDKRGRWHEYWSVV